MITISYPLRPKMIVLISNVGPLTIVRVVVSMTHNIENANY